MLKMRGAQCDSSLRGSGNVARMRARMKSRA
jgi:hypothetical protein